MAGGSYCDRKQSYCPEQSLEHTSALHDVVLLFMMLHILFCIDLHINCSTTPSCYCVIIMHIKRFSCYIAYFYVYRNLNEDSSLGLRKIISQSTESLNFRSRAMSMESLNDDGEQG